jgi:ribonuclease-3 family protein
VTEIDLARRSIRTWAWLGDAEFERLVRRRVAARGDYPTDRLDAIKARVVRAEGQAALLAQIQDDLDDAEQAVVRRARNTRLSGSAGSRRNVQAYRAATALEALVAYWVLGPGDDRTDAVLGAPLEAAIDQAVARHKKKPRRG